MSCRTALVLAPLAALILTWVWPLSIRASTTDTSQRSLNYHSPSVALLDHATPIPAPETHTLGVPLQGADAVDSLQSALSDAIVRASAWLQHQRQVNGDSLLYPYELSFNHIGPIALDTLSAALTMLGPSDRAAANGIIRQSGYLQMYSAAVGIQAVATQSLSAGGLLLGLVGKLKKMVAGIADEDNNDVVQILDKIIDNIKELIP